MTEEELKTEITALQIDGDVQRQTIEKLQAKNYDLTQKVKRLEEANELLKELEDVKDSLIKHQRLLLRTFHR